MAHTHPTAAAAAPKSEALRCAEWLEHIARGGDVLNIDELAWAAAAELRSLDALTTDGLAWAIHRWEDEVKHRPLINVHRRSLDGAWREVVRYFGGSPETLLGPSHDELIAAPQAAEPVPTEPAAPAQDADGRAFRTAARLGLTLRMHGGCAQSGMPGSPSAYEVVDVADRAEAMREAVARAEAVIAAGGEPQRLQQAPATAAAPALLEGRAHLTYTLTAESGYEQTGEHHNITPQVFGAMVAVLHGTQPAGDGWEPIETAPKSRADGSHVHGIYLQGYVPDADACNLESNICVVWWEPHMNKGRGLWYGEGGHEVKPTHWRPLPAPPTACAQQDGPNASGSDAAIDVDRAQR